MRDRRVTCTRDKLHSATLVTTNASKSTHRSVIDTTAELHLTSLHLRGNENQSRPWASATRNSGVLPNIFCRSEKSISCPKLSKVIRVPAINNISMVSLTKSSNKRAINSPVHFAHDTWELYGSTNYYSYSLASAPEERPIFGSPARLRCPSTRCVIAVCLCAVATRHLFTLAKKEKRKKERRKATFASSPFLRAFPQRILRRAF